MTLRLAGHFGSSRRGADDRILSSALIHSSVVQSFLGHYTGYLEAGETPGILEGRRRRIFGRQNKIRQKKVWVDSGSGNLASE